MSSKLIVRAGPEQREALKEMDKLIEHLALLQDSSLFHDDSGSVDMSDAIKKAELLRNYIDSLPEKRIDWKEIIQAISFIIQIILNMYS